MNGEVTRSRASRRPPSARSPREPGIQSDKRKARPQTTRSRQWIVIASFLTAESLIQAVNALSGLNCKTRQMCLVAIDRQIRDVRERKVESAIAAELAVRATEIDFGLAQQNPFATRKRIAIEANDDGGIPREMLGERLEAIRSGAILLFVRIADANDIAAATRALLKHSSHHVQTREIAA